jgi:surface protein
LAIKTEEKRRAYDYDGQSIVVDTLKAVLSVKKARLTFDETKKLVDNGFRALDPFKFADINIPGLVLPQKIDNDNIKQLVDTWIHHYDYDGSLELEDRHHISNWGVSNVTDMSDMFREAESFNGDLSKWKVSKVTNMSNMFAFAGSFNGDMSKWDVSKVTNMRAMVLFATSFNGDLSKWKVSKVTNMSDMFREAESFNGDLSKWKVSKVTNMVNMFLSAKSLTGT